MPVGFDRVVRKPALVIGSGIAGLTAALSMEGAAVITKTPLGLGGSSSWAQGGIAVAWDEADSPADHAVDTLTVAAGLADAHAVEVLTAEGPAQVRWLVDIGARFDTRDDGKLVLGREAGHRVRRIVHANGDATGAEVMRALRSAVIARSDIDEVNGVATDLLRSGSQIVGAAVMESDGTFTAYLAPAVVLATGGIGHVYAKTTNPPAVRGDGLAMAIRAGARMADLEFVQFHPTALAAGADPMPLLTEALRGEGAILLDRNERRFMPDIHPDAELAPRDVVARANYRVQQDGLEPVLDARAAVGESFPERFPTVFGYAQEAGIDPRVEVMPVSPAVHYYMGGVDVDEDGRTSVAGLWAVGEVSSSGVHGANRLASNSLLEGLVFGRRVGRDITASARQLDRTVAFEVPLAGIQPYVKSDAELVQNLRQLMWDNVGVERDGGRLEDARNRFRAVLADAGRTRLRNLALVGMLVAQAALDREESRGGHYRLDFPETKPGWAERTLMTRDAEQGVTFLADSEDGLVPGTAELVHSANAVTRHTGVA